MKDNEPGVSPSFATCPQVIREVVQWHAIEHAFLRHGTFARHFDFPNVWLCSAFGVPSFLALCFPFWLMIGQPTIDCLKIIIHGIT
jgi:hypothetical protein